MKRALFIILISLLPLVCHAQDQVINARNINIQITNPGGPSGKLPWSTLSNQTYVLAPSSPDNGFCVSVVNNNPTNAHTFTIAAFQTGDSSVTDYSNNTGRYAPLTVVGTPSPVAAATTSTFFVRSNGAAKVAFQFAGGGTLGGNPDTVDIFAVQTTASGCGTVNPGTGQTYTLATANTGTSSAPPILAVSDGLSQGFYFGSSVSNPGVLSVIGGVQVNTTSSKNLYIDKVVIASGASTTATINFAMATAAGTGGGCAAFNTVSNTKVGNVTTSIAQGFFGTCTTLPSGAPAAAQLFLSSNSSIVIDLKGLIIPGVIGNGFYITVTGILTGTVSASTFWYEK